ncbi:MAG: glutamine--tRNA ligase/YqeY domain fusion protein [Myxococcales bacterium]|nr:glutamine--tRNA ligase/YqeY domain fusion protein [Myxococcales bacterium]
MEEGAGGNHFIRKLVSQDLASGRRRGPVVTRFPPEPNGHLHIGHAKSICLNFGIAEEFGGRCHLRFDDTNPSTEETEYVEAIQQDVRWLGFSWGEHLYFSSDRFDELYAFARQLIEKGKAFVCDLSSEEIFARRGTLTEPGEPSPFRGRSVEENLDLFTRMREGAFPPGSRVLRAKIDMGSSVLPMRDPVLYRIVADSHHRTGDRWPIYPLYDFAHCLTDALEGVTHSLCTLEFADHRPLYDWILAQLEIPDPPEQTEFARLNLSHTVMSKRALRKLVEGSYVAGWDDPRMPTLSGLRRRGYTPEALRNFCEGIGVARRDNTIQLARLEFSLREDLNRRANRAMAVLNPLRVVIENYPDHGVEELDAINNPEDPSQGQRKVPFSKILWIERDDFMEDPPKKFFRLAPGREVRLRYAYFITCREVVKDESGEIVELRCTYDPATRGGDSPDGRKVKGTLHWVADSGAIEAEVRLYDVLFRSEDPMMAGDGDFLGDLNPASLEVIRGARLEPSLATYRPGESVQFERLGYFCADPDGSQETPVFNRAVTLRDTWAKTQKNTPQG